MKQVRVSIIIRTLNEARYLPRLLEAIAFQKSDFGKEVIIVDSGSNDGTLEIAKAHECRIINIKKCDFSYGRSLNLGCAAANGDYLVMISGHCVPCHGSWLQRIVRPLEEGLVTYAYGRQIGGDQTYWSEHRIFSKYFPSASEVPQDGIYCNNANSALKKKAWERFKFDEELTGLEDTHLAQKIVSSGQKIGYVAEAVVFHYHHENWAQVQRRFEREAVALKHIRPEISVRKRDFIRYLLKSVLGDVSHAVSQGKGVSIWPEIWRYRFAQYWGSYCGSQLNRNISATLRESYFYPTNAKGGVLRYLGTQTNSSTVNLNSHQHAMRVTALLPMKAHSARVSGKNFKVFCGKPLFRWILDTLLEVEEIDQIVINTDARDILISHGLEETPRVVIRDRRPEICGDFVSMNKIISDDIDNISSDIYLMTHTTNPLLSASTVSKAIRLYKDCIVNQTHDSLFTVDRVQERFFKQDATPVNHDLTNLVRTQDLEPWYRENSNLYLFSKESFARNNARIGTNPYMLPIPKSESVDIDDPEDWNMAIAIAKYLLQDSPVN